MRKKVWTHYSKEFKCRVVQQIINGKFTKEAARKVYGIRGNCTIAYWMSQYSGNDGCQANQKIGNFEDMAQDKALTELNAKIALLQEELCRANLRADLWQKLVEVAEKELQIDIKKKFGAQPLNVLSEKKSVQK